MSDPVITPCPANKWTKVATNVTSGIVHIMSTDPSEYVQTYRDTGGSVPTTLADGVSFETPLLISALAGIDVYIRPSGRAGSVRVDL